MTGEYLTIADAGRIIGVSRNQAYVLARKGILKTVAVAGRRLVLRSAAEDLDRSGWWGRGRSKRRVSSRKSQNN